MKTLSIDQLTIKYMRGIALNYSQLYIKMQETIFQLEEVDSTEKELKEKLEEDCQDLILTMFNALQPILTMYEDTKPENIQNTLDGKSMSKMFLITDHDHTVN